MTFTGDKVPQDVKDDVEIWLDALTQGRMDVVQQALKVSEDYHDESEMACNFYHYMREWQLQRIASARQAFFQAYESPSLRVRMNKRKYRQPSPALPRNAPSKYRKLYLSIESSTSMPGPARQELDPSPLRNVMLVGDPTADLNTTCGDARGRSPTRKPFKDAIQDGPSDTSRPPVGHGLVPEGAKKPRMPLPTSRPTHRPPTPGPPPFRRYFEVEQEDPTPPRPSSSRPSEPGLEVPAWALEDQEDQEDQESEYRHGSAGFAPKPNWSLENEQGDQESSSGKGKGKAKEKAEAASQGNQGDDKSSDEKEESDGSAKSDAVDAQARVTDEDEDEGDDDDDTIPAIIVTHADDAEQAPPDLRFYHC